MITAIDFGYSTVKMLQLSNGSSGYSVHKSGVKRVTEDLKTFDPEKMSKANWVAAIQDLANELGINPKKVKNLVTSISGNGVSVKQVSTMEMSEDEMVNSLEFEARKHIPLDGSEPVIDFHLLGQDKTELDKTNVLLVATTKNVVINHHDIIKDSGFKPNIFDTESVAIANCFQHKHNFPDTGVDVIFNIGAMNTTILVWGQGQKFFTRELPIAGHHFTEAIKKAKGVDYEQAEAIKHEKGIDSLTTDNTSENTGESEDKFSLSVEKQTIFNSLNDEIRKTLRYYMKSNSQTRFNNFYLCGGSANLPGLKDFIAETLKIELNMLDPFEDMAQGESVENPQAFVVAAGMAIRGAAAA